MFQIYNNWYKIQNGHKNSQWRPFLGCLGFNVPLKKISLIWRRHHYRLKAENFYLCSALLTIEQWGVCSVPHLLWHGASVYIGHLRAPATLRPDSRTFGSGAVTTCFYDWSLSQVGFEHQYKQNNNANWFKVLLKRVQKNRGPV